jgi:hypothetical protein
MVQDRLVLCCIGLLVHVFTCISGLRHRYGADLPYYTLHRVPSTLSLTLQIHPLFLPRSGFTLHPVLFKASRRQFKVIVRRFPFGFSADPQAFALPLVDLSDAPDGGTVAVEILP